MQKSDAINLFGNVTKMAEALGCTRQAIHRWNNCLTQPQVDRIRGAYTRIAEDRDKLLVHTLEKG